MWEIIGISALVVAEVAPIIFFGIRLRRRNRELNELKKELAKVTQTNENLNKTTNDWRQNINKLTAELHRLRAQAGDKKVAIIHTKDSVIKTIIELVEKYADWRWFFTNGSLAHWPKKNCATEKDLAADVLGDDPAQAAYVAKWLQENNMRAERMDMSNATNIIRELQQMLEE